MGYFGVNNLPVEISSVYFGFDKSPILITEIYMGINNVPVKIWPIYYNEDRDLSSESWNFYKQDYDYDYTLIQEDAVIGTSYAGYIKNSGTYLYYQTQNKIDLSGYKYVYVSFYSPCNFSTRLAYTQTFPSNMDGDNENILAYGTKLDLLPTGESNLLILYKIPTSSLSNPTYLKIGISCSGASGTFDLKLNSIILTNHPEKYTYHNNVTL